MSGVSTAVIPLVSGLGGALIGAMGSTLGPAWLQRIKTKDDREQQATNVQRQQEAERLEALARVRALARMWLIATEGSLQDLRAGRKISLSEFDGRVLEALQNATNEIYMLVLHTFESGEYREEPPVPEMHSITLAIRERVATGDKDRTALDALSRRAHEITSLVTMYLLNESFSPYHSFTFIAHMGTF